MPLHRTALVLASIFNQNKPMVIEIDDLAPRRVACAHYHGPFGPAAFRTFERLREWQQMGNVIEVDRFDRPLAMGVHLDTPFRTALEDTDYLACIWIPDHTPAMITSEIDIGHRLGGLHSRSEFVGPSIWSTFSQAFAMEKQLHQLPGQFTKDPDERGWWEHYSPQSWDELIHGRVRSAWVGFRVETPLTHAVPTSSPGAVPVESDQD